MLFLRSSSVLHGSTSVGFSIHPLELKVESPHKVHQLVNVVLSPHHQMQKKHYDQSSCLHLLHPIDQNVVQDNCGFKQLQNFLSNLLFSVIVKQMDCNHGNRPFSIPMQCSDIILILASFFIEFDVLLWNGSVLRLFEC